MSDSKGTVGIEWSVPAIRVGNRHRKAHGDLNQLVASIKRVGLLQPITITPDGFLICGARRLAAIKLLGWNTVRVWIRSGLSDRLGQLLAEQDENTLHKPFTPMEGAALYRELKDLLAEDAKKRSELTQFHAGHAPGEHGGANLPTPPGTAGSTRAQAAAMVPGGVSYATFDKIGYLEKVTADTTMPNELRARARAELERIEAGGPVDPAFVRIRNEAEAPPGTSDAELHRLAEEALARVKAERRAKRKKIRKPIPIRRSDGPFPTRAFVLTWGELTDWWERYDLHQLAVELTDEQIEGFHTALDGSFTFAKQLNAAREEVPPEQRGRQADRRAHLRAL
ncbi:ParB N-terminal domain-containing protein [Psychromicrobium xiongbiense]|uniref:ParB N-terminal domain-containing protein n=1 Tax=Psychromicrobium xiongbiense TaxID=3051184 RepID=UPI0025524F0E|nr:ParB N-terminal domain-containing protein [Psychromicrobium sp. YIM S02556]